MLQEMFGLGSKKAGHLQSLRAEKPFPDLILSLYPTQLSFANLLSPLFFPPSCRVAAWFNTYCFDSLAPSSGKTRQGTSPDIRCEIFKDLSFLLCLSNVCWNFFFPYLGATGFAKVSLLVTKPF